MEQNKKKGKGPIKAFSQPCTTGPDKAHVDATKTNPIMEPMILGEVPLTGVDATCSRPLGNAGVDQHTRTPQLTLTVFLHLSRCARRYLKVAKDIRQSKTWSYEEHIRVLFLSRNIIQVNTLQKEVFIHKTTYIVMIVFIVLSHMFRFDESSLLLHCSDLLNLMKKNKIHQYGTEQKERQRAY